jgi:predicted nuclease with TOPRIM domain
LDYLSEIGRKETVKAGKEIVKNKNNFDIPDFGQRKRNPLSSPDKKDRIINLEKENNTLKEKENLLQTEVMKMQTKLRRIEGLIRSRSAVGGDSATYDSYDLQQDL